MPAYPLTLKRFEKTMVAQATLAHASSKAHAVPALRSARRLFTPAAMRCDIIVYLAAVTRQRMTTF
jgi:hypothetical protein